MEQDAEALIRQAFLSEYPDIQFQQFVLPDRAYLSITTMGIRFHWVAPSSHLVWCCAYEHLFGRSVFGLICKEK